jgi:hypothetical protein
MATPTAYIIMPIAGESLTACNQYAQLQGLTPESRTALEFHRQRVMAVKQLVAEAARMHFKLKYNGKPPADATLKWKELIRDIEVMMLVYGYSYDNVVSTLSRMGIWFHSYEGEHAIANTPEFIPFTDAEMANRVVELRTQRLRDSLAAMNGTTADEVPQPLPAPQLEVAANDEDCTLLPVTQTPATEVLADTVPRDCAHASVAEPDCISSEECGSSLGEEDGFLSAQEESAAVEVC